jgi:hypothetical protein
MLFVNTKIADMPERLILYTSISYFQRDTVARL